MLADSLLNASSRRLVAAEASIGYLTATQHKYRPGINVPSILDHTPTCFRHEYRDRDQHNHRANK